MGGGEGEVTAPHPHPHTSHTPSLLSQRVHEGTQRETVPSLPPRPFLLPSPSPLPPPPPTPTHGPQITPCNLWLPALFSFTPFLYLYTYIYISVELLQSLSTRPTVWLSSVLLEIRATTDTPKTLSQQAAWLYHTRGLIFFEPSLVFLSISHLSPLCIHPSLAP